MLKNAWRCLEGPKRPEHVENGANLGVKIEGKLNKHRVSCYSKTLYSSSGTLILLRNAYKAQKRNPRAALGDPRAALGAARAALGAPRAALGAPRESKVAI